MSKGKPPSAHHNVLNYGAWYWPYSYLYLWHHKDLEVRLQIHYCLRSETFPRDKEEMSKYL